MTSTLIRSNIFVQSKDEAFVKQYAQENKLKKSEVFAEAIKLLRREQLKKEAAAYYAQSENSEFEAMLAAEGGVFDNNSEA